MTPQITSDAITVWPFHRAPIHLQNLSENGGDEDWLGLIPPGMEVPHWMEGGTPFGCCCVDEIPHPYRSGWTVVIGCHA